MERERINFFIKFVISKKAVIFFKSGNFLKISEY